MNWLVDAQLPRRLALALRQRGHDAIHTLDLPDGNSTTDVAIIACAEREARVVVTRDATSCRTASSNGGHVSCS